MQKNSELIEAMGKQNLSNKELAFKSGFSERTINNVLACRKVRDKTLIRILSVAGICVNFPKINV